MHQTSVRSFKGVANSVIRNISREDIRLIYQFEHRIGEGSFGTVRLACKTSNPLKKFAIKTLSREKIEESKTNIFDLEQELSIMLSVDHPYIATFYEAYLDHKYVHLVMKYCEGGDLYTKLMKTDLFGASVAILAQDV